MGLIGTHWGRFDTQQDSLRLIGSHWGRYDTHLGLIRTHQDSSGLIRTHQDSSGLLNTSYIVDANVVRVFLTGACPLPNQLNFWVPPPPFPTMKNEKSHKFLHVSHTILAAPHHFYLPPNTHTHTHTHTHTNTIKHTHTHTHAFMHTHIHTHTHT